MTRATRAGALRSDLSGTEVLARMTSIVATVPAYAGLVPENIRPRFVLEAADVPVIRFEHETGRVLVRQPIAYWEEGMRPWT